MVKSIRFAELPILTETVDSTSLDLPTLTEAIEEHIATLSHEQCRQLAERLFPKLAAILLDALSSSPETSWQAAMHQVHAALPELIHNASRESR